MSAPDWQKVKDVFALALKQPGERRHAFLSAACAGDPALLEEVESLLRAHEEPEALFEKSEFGVASLFGAGGGGCEGRLFGNYRVVRELGRGGMGAVYLAARADDEYQQHVALKVIKRGLDTDEVRRRFRNERQILARLEHPNITRLLDGGTADDGSAYLVMEYVEGRALHEYADEQRLSTAARLELFRTVCSAVSYAHQNLVIHRDLKPSNILVTPEGTPKLLDFGIAKLLHGEGQAEADTQTGLGLRVLTPEYASPEQTRGAPVTTATDVYSLGVVLYELLTGHRPYRFAGRGPDEIARVICEDEPARPSVAVSRTGEVGGASATGGGGAPDGAGEGQGRRATERLRSALKGDLDNIVLMAMRKEPGRRYVSVALLSEDIRRHLEGLPVLAHKDTFGYRAEKFLRRNKVAASAGALIVLSLVVGLSVSLAQYRNAQRERAKAEDVNRFLQTILSTSNPAVNLAGAKGRETTVNDALDIATRRLEGGELSGQPEVKAELQWVIGTSYQSQGRYDLADKNLRAALAAQSRLFGEDSPEILKSLVPLASLALTNADYASAEQFYDRRLNILRAEQRTGRIRAEELLSALNDFALVRRARGNSQEAEALLREGLALRSQIPPDGAGVVETVQAILALTLLDQGRFEEAEGYARSLVAEIREKENSGSQGLCAALTMLGSVLLEKGELDEAEANLREAEALYRKLFDPNYVATYDNVRLQAHGLYLKGDYAGAEAKIEQCLENYRQNARPQYISFATALTTKGLILHKLGRASEAEKTLREAVRLRDENLPKQHFMSALSKGALGEVLLEQRRFAEAEPLLLESFETLKVSQAVDNPRTSSARQRLAKLYSQWEKPARNPM